MINRLLIDCHPVLSIILLKHKEIFLSAKDPGIVDLCEDNVCSLTHPREDSASTAEVILVFGIKGLLVLIQEHSLMN